MRPDVRPVALGGRPRHALLESTCATTACRSNCHGSPGFPQCSTGKFLSHRRRRSSAGRDHPRHVQSAFFPTTDVTRPASGSASDVTRSVLVTRSTLMPRCLNARAFAAILEYSFHEPYDLFAALLCQLVKRFFCSEEREKQARAMPAFMGSPGRTRCPPRASGDRFPSTGAPSVPMIGGPRRVLLKYRRADFGRKLTMTIWNRSSPSLLGLRRGARHWRANWFNV